MNFTVIITNNKEYNNRLLLPIEVKKAWIDALKSGKFLKGKDYLNNNNKFCCLGVLCEISNEQKSHKNNLFYYNNSPYAYVGKHWGILNRTGEFQGFVIKIKEDGVLFKNLANINDFEEFEFDFNLIADIIQEVF